MKPILCLVVSLQLVLSLPAPAGVSSTNNYPHSIELSPDYKVFWKHDDTYITFEIHAKTEGWVGFGVSPDGKLTGSDVFIGSADDDEAKGHDYHATSETALLKDAQQDWVLLHGKEEDDYSIFVITRKLENCDPNPGNDITIQGGTARLVFTIGSSDSFEDDDDSDQATEWQSRSAVLINPEPAVPDLPADVITLDLKFNNAPVPSAEAAYWCELIPVPPLTTKHHMIRFEPMIQPGHEDLVHHIVVDACTKEINPQYVNVGASCFDTPWTLPVFTEACTANVIPWAIGGGPFTYPDNAGYPFGAGEIKYLRFEIHYNNTQERSDILDSSGIRLYLTSTLREHDAGNVLIGPYSGFVDVPPHYEKLTTRGYCPSQCLDLVMGGIQELNVFATFAHTHTLAKTLKFRHERNGVELPSFGEELHIDPAFQPYQRLTNEVKIKKGDNLMTQCTLDSTGQTTPNLGGDSVQGQMCGGILIYYPKLKITECMTNPTQKQAMSYLGNGEYDSSGNYILTDGPYAGKGLRDVLFALDWTDENNRNAYQNAILGPEHQLLCLEFWFVPLPINGLVFQAPEITTPYVEPNQCPAK